MLGFEFEGPADPGLVPAVGGAKPQIEAGALKVPGRHGEEYLTGGKPLALPRAEVGEILVGPGTKQKTWASLAWSSANEPGKCLGPPRRGLIGDGEFHTYRVSKKGGEP